MAGPVYLDHNATAPLRPEAREAVLRALEEAGNPSSVHQAGRAARRILEEARAAVAGLVGAGAEEVVFTSGGTEANALAIAGAGRPRVLASAVEHDSVRAAAPDHEPIPVDGDGLVDLAALDRLLAADRRPALVSVMLANNETGVIQPVAAVAEIARRHGALLHSDAVQAAGRVAVPMPALGVDLMSLSAHKIGGPKGAGALVVRDGLDLAPLLRGGGQERRRRAGTENLPGIAGFGAAAAAAAADAPAWRRIAALRDALEAAILSAAGARVLGGGAPRLPNTSCLAMAGVASETQVMHFDLSGICVGAGAACSSGKVARSHVLAAMGAGEAAGQTVRVSLGTATTEAEIEAFVAAWRALHARAAARAA